MFRQSIKKRESNFLEIKGRRETEIWKKKKAERQRHRYGVKEEGSAYPEFSFHRNTS